MPLAMPLSRSAAASSSGSQPHACTHTQRATPGLCQDKAAGQQTGLLMGCLQPRVKISGRKD